MRKLADSFFLQVPQNILATSIVLFMAFHFSACAKIGHISPHLNYAVKEGLTQTLDPSPDSAYLVLLRPERQYGTATILDGDKFVTMLTNNTHFIYKTNPGPHHFMGYMTRSGPSLVDAELEAGKIYFAAIKLQEGALTSWYELLPIVPGSEFWPKISHWLSESKEVRPNASGSDWFEVNKDELYQSRVSRNQASRNHVIKRSSGVDRIP